ncbi:hypothetical protein [Cupriavidus basilensis]|uniref:hypothetical protein n=1 Tax=Cupriavidus basilensis TaxID=68895 RepID=UPI00157B1204|nr:hypothetical protein [Cupriavidus basilensis]NUA28904.1 hypothetical protein [Cupriavidus basilensis]
MQTVISDNESAPAAAPAGSWRRPTHRACATLAVCSAIAALGWIAWICWRLVSAIAPGSMSFVDALMVLVMLVFTCGAAVTVCAVCEMGQR